MKLLIADQFPDVYVQRFKKLGLDVIYNPKLGENDLPEAAKEADILVVRSTNITAETINKSKCLNLIVRAGAGVNNINLPAANQKGVYVANCPGKNSIAVAELAIGLMIALDRRIADNVIDFRNGIWNKGEYSKAEGLHGKSLAIVGVGNIGKEVAIRADALGMKVYGKDINQMEDVPITYINDMEQLLPMADLISIHLPLNKETTSLFDEKMFGLIKPGTILINTSRAEVINEEALIKAVKEKKLRVGLDVFAGEPEEKSGKFSSALQGLPNVYVTHHIGASTEQAQNAVAEETVKIIHDFMKTGSIAHWVNRAKKTDSHFQLIIKHHDKPGVLAHVLDVLRSGDINVEEVENVIFEGGIAACCTMHINKSASSEMLDKINEHKDIINVAHLMI